jgi:hypothetical protein
MNSLRAERDQTRRRWEASARVRGRPPTGADDAGGRRATACARKPRYSVHVRREHHARTAFLGAAGEARTPPSPSVLNARPRSSRTKIAHRCRRRCWACVYPEEAEDFGETGGHGWKRAEVKDGRWRMRIEGRRVGA